MPKLSANSQLNISKVIIITALMLGSCLFAIKVHADDPCKNITDFDKKNQCYTDQTNKKKKQVDSLAQQLEDIGNQKDTISNKITNLASQLNITQSQMDELNAEIDVIENKLEIINTNLEERRAKLNDKINLRNQIIRNYSKRNTLNGLEMFLSSEGTAGLNGFQYAALSYAFNKSASEQMISLIQALSVEITSFEKDKSESESLKVDLNGEHQKLITLKSDLANKKNDAQGTFNDLNKKEAVVSDELKNVEKAIADLNQKQQDLLKQKYGDSYNTVGDYESPGSKTPSPSFSPAFAAFSYGAYTHYNGMSQYGAKGRADDGKKYTEILKFYYKVGTVTNSSFPKTISVKGYGTMDFQKYLYGIAEMPSNWPIEALKAQAVAARTFAYRSGKPICTTEACQVFSKSKSDNPPSLWKQAVDATKNEILNNPSNSQYSSTTGGYINNIGWDVKGKWPGDSYEKRAGSPWFYKAWYTKGYSGSDSCGHSTPWLTSKEMADILNTWVVWRKGSSSDRDNLSPVTTSCWGGNPYSMDKMAQRADDLGEKYTSVSSVDVSISTSGFTSKVTIKTDQGAVTIDGDAFETVFNLRAPGYISIKSRLYDFEVR